MYGTNLNNAKYDRIDAFCNEGHSSDGVSHSFNPLLIKITDNYISYVVDVSLGSVTCSGIEFRMIGYSDTNITRVEYSRLDKRVIVAGGGGGGSNYMSVSLNGGSGGGTQAGQIYYANFPSDGISYLSNNMGASQSASGLANKDTGWSFDIELRPGTYGLGNKLAGGGYYGGSSYGTTNRIYSGTGGSGYVSSILTEASTQSKVSASYGSAYVEAVSYEN